MKFDIKDKVSGARYCLIGYVVCLVLAMLLLGFEKKVDNEYKYSKDALVSLMDMESVMPLNIISDDFVALIDTREESLLKMYYGYLDTIPDTIPYVPGVWYEAFDSSQVSAINAFRNNLQRLIEDSRINPTIRRLINDKLLYDSVYLLSSDSEDYNTVLVGWYQARDANESLIKNSSGRFDGIVALQSTRDCIEVVVNGMILGMIAFPFAAHVLLQIAHAQRKSNK